MSENDFLVPPDPQHIPTEAELQAKLEAKLNSLSYGEPSFKQPNTGLSKSIQLKEEKEKNNLKKIFENRQEIPEKVKPLMEAEHTYTRHVMPPTVSPNPVKIPDIPAINKEHEPKSLNWIPITDAFFTTIETISDVSQTLAAAKQQRNVSFGLVNPKRGTTCFIKVDDAGTLLMAKPEEDPKAWANPGLNFDGDFDADGKEGTAKDFVPNTRTTSGWPYLSREAHALENKEKESATLIEALDLEIEEALSIDHINNPHQKALVKKLLDMATELRRKEPILKDDKDELPLAKDTNNILVEDTKVNEDEIDLNHLSKLAMEISLLRKQDDSEQLEDVEDELLNFIAESLLLGVTKVQKFIFESYVEKVNDCLES